MRMVLRVFLMCWRLPWAFASHHQHPGEMIIEWSLLLTMGLRWWLSGPPGNYRMVKIRKEQWGHQLQPPFLMLVVLQTPARSPTLPLLLSFSSSSCSPLAAPQSIWLSKMKCGREGRPNGSLPTAPNNLADFWSHQLPVWGDQVAKAFIDGEDVAWACQELCWG